MSIVNFEEYTSELSPDEIAAAEIITARLKSNVGKKMARTNKRIADVMKEHYGIKLSGARMRKIINWIRIKGLVPNLIATSQGYYVSQDKEEIEKYIYSLRQRARAILAVGAAMEDNLTHNNSLNMKTT